MSESKPPRPDYEQARMRLVGGEPKTSTAEELAAVPDGTRFDKAPPTAPPTPRVRPIPTHLKKIMAFFEGLVVDEGLLVDLCLDRAMEIVRQNVESKLVGIDLMQDGQGGAGPFNPGNYAAIAAPLAVELYKQVLRAIDGRKDEYEALFDEAQRELEKSRPGASRLVLPP